MTPSDPSSRRTGPLIIAILVLILLILHQDNWFWTDRRLVLGFLPIGLFWHACISIAAAATWWLATKIAWPFEDSDQPAPSATAGVADVGSTEAAAEGRPE